MRIFPRSGFEIPSAETLDFILFARIGDAVIHLVWENLLNSEYAVTVFYPAADRSFRFGVTWTLPQLLLPELRIFW